MSIAEDIVVGLQCSWCGICFKREHTYPVLCKDCYKDAMREYRTEKKLSKIGLQKATNKEC